MLVIRPRNPLDAEEARRLVETLDALPASARVRVDLSAVREVHATGLAALALALDRDGRVTIAGLRRHEERILAYLLARPPAPARDPRRPSPGAAVESSSTAARDG